jgi:hypothetical protein
MTPQSQSPQDTEEDGEMNSCIDNMRTTTRMNQTKLAIALAGLTLLAAGLVPSAPGREPDTLRVYFLGNSLTRGLSPDRLAKLCAATGTSLEYGTQLGAGVNLDEHWLQQRLYNGTPMLMNHLEPGGQFRSDRSAGEAKFGDYRRALQQHTFDALVLQPYLGYLDAGQYSEANQKRGHFGDREAIRRFIAYARGRNEAKNTAAKRFYLYAAWPRLEGIEARKVDTDGDGVFSYSEFYKAPFEIFDYGAKKSVPSRDYVDRLFTAVREEHRELANEIRLIPAGIVLNELDERIRAGELPGIARYFERNREHYLAARLDKRATLEEARFPFDPGPSGFDPKQGVKNFYADLVHMNDQPHNGPECGTIGAYVAAATVATVLTGEDPAKCPPDTVAAIYEKFDAEEDAVLVRAIQKTVWSVVTSDSRTGV